MEHVTFEPWMRANPSWCGEDILVEAPKTAADGDGAQEDKSQPSTTSSATLTSDLLGILSR